MDNVKLRCRAHNAYEADLFFCRERMLAREVRPAIERVFFRKNDTRVDDIFSLRDEGVNKTFSVRN